jgi:hypothetical protein
MSKKIEEISKENKEILKENKEIKEHLYKRNEDQINNKEENNEKKMKYLKMLNPKMKK